MVILISEWPSNIQAFSTPCELAIIVAKVCRSPWNEIRLTPALSELLTTTLCKVLCEKGNPLFVTKTNWSFHFLEEANQSLCNIVRTSACKGMVRSRLFFVPLKVLSISKVLWILALLREEILRQELTPNYAFKLPTLIHNVQVQESDSISDNQR